MIDFKQRSKTAYNKKADGYDSSREGKFTQNIQHLLLAEMNWLENQNVLDVACGTGSLLKAMNDRTPIKGFGVDISEQMIKNAAERNPDMTFHVSGCEEMPLENESMDIITVCAAYHHFPYPAAFVKEANRILKPKGTVYIADLHIPAFLRVLVNPFVPLLLKDGDVKLYSPKGIVADFMRLGFDSAKYKIIGNAQIVLLKKGK